MNRDRNFERRLMVNKFSNRPPFDLKKPKEVYGIEDKIKAYPEEACRSCCRKRIETSVDLKTNRSLPSKDTGEEMRTTPGKRIIETFQKITPAEQLENPVVSQNSSIQTIYRNSKTYQLGKNIPKHKLMKSLLQNLDPEEPCENKGFPNKGRLKYKSSKKQFFEKDEVVRPDFSVSFDFKQNNRDARHGEHFETSPQKVDKRTSTTGLPWPPKSIQYSSANCHLKKRSSQSCRCNKMNSASYNTVKEEQKRDVRLKFSSDSFLEETPTKDVPHFRKGQVVVNIPNKLLETRSSERREPRREKSSNTTMQMHNSAQKLKAREKTFVQAQVEKLNKVLKTPKLPDSRYAKEFSGALRQGLEHRIPQHLSHGPNRKEINSNYMGLMNKIRTNCPRFESSSNVHTFESDDEWSEATETSNISERIKFPKETKIAVDQHFSQRRPRIPLSKFTKIHENCRPAFIPHRETTNEHLHPEEFDDLNQQGDYMRKDKQMPLKYTDVRKLGQAQTKAKLNIPCKKNLLCDKGEQHKGPCGYTHNNNKVIY